MTRRLIAFLTACVLSFAPYRVLDRLGRSAPAWGTRWTIAASAWFIKDRRRGV